MMVSTTHTKATSARKGLLFLTVFALLCGCCLFADGLPLNDSDIESKWFAAVFLSAILLLVAVCMVWKEKGPFSLRQSDIIVSVLFFYITLRGLAGESPLFWLRLAAIALLYASFRLLDDSLLVSLEAIVTMLCTMLALWGIGQALHLLPVGKRGFPIVGNFDNPAGFASALAAGFSFAFSSAQGRNGAARILSFLPAILMVLAIVFSGSRAGLLAVVVIVMIVLAHKVKVSRFAMIAACTFSLLAMSLALYFLKKDSADGRLLIWLVSMRLFIRHPLFGGGSGAFLREYMPEQASFFQMHPESRLSFLADNISHPFNEYLSFLIQWGMVGAMLCVALAVVIIKSWKRNRTQENAALLLALTAMGIFALFSYPMNYPFGWLVASMAVGIIGRCTPEVHRLKWHPLISCTAGMLPAIVVLCGTFVQYGNYSRWHALSHHRPHVSPEVLYEGYEALYPALHADPLFLYNYAAEMHNLNRDDAALTLATSCQTRRDDYVVEHLKGDILRSVERREEAHAAYETMCNMCPNRFIPLYRLFQLAEEDGDAEKANVLAKEIIQKPVKIQSHQVDFIKARCKNYINNQFNNK